MGGRARRVALLCGGGLTEVAGGIGQLTSCLLEVWAADGAPPGRYVVIDTRGGGGRLGGIGAFAGAFARLAGLRARGRLDLVHANMSTRGSAVRKCLLCMAAQLARTPTVMHLHGADLDGFYRRQGPAMRLLMRTTLRRCARVIVLGASWQAFVVDEMGVPTALVANVPNGVRRPSPDIAEPWRGGVGRTPRIAFLGRLGARKGVPELIAALSSPDVRARDWHATLAGDGAVETTRGAVAARGLAGRIDVPGWVDRAGTAALLREADIFVLPSHHEGMPLAILEALAHGVAVIATPVGSNPEYLRDRENALLVAPGDVPALAQAIGRLLDEPRLRARLAAAGRATFEAELDIGPVARRIAAIHEAALNRPNRREKSA